jgi:hypothetical protein
MGGVLSTSGDMGPPDSRRASRNAVGGTGLLTGGTGGLLTGMSGGGLMTGMTGMTGGLNSFGAFSSSNSLGALGIGKCHVSQ